jgi:hypothetical protein
VRGAIEGGCAGTSGGRHRALGIEHTSGSCSRHESWELALGRRRSAEDDPAERALAEFVHNQGQLFPAEQARIAQLLVERVDVKEDALEVRIRAEGLASPSKRAATARRKDSSIIQSTMTKLDGNTLVVRVPMHFQRRGGRNRIVAPDGSALARVRSRSRTAHS